MPQSKAMKKNTTCLPNSKYIKNILLKCPFLNQLYTIRCKYTNVQNLYTHICTYIHIYIHTYTWLPDTLLLRVPDNLVSFLYHSDIYIYIYIDIDKNIDIY